MSDFFKSAMGYFNGPADSNNGSSSVNGEGGSSSSTTGPETDFIGQLVEVNAMKLRIKRLIAMGEWSLQYIVPSANSTSVSFVGGYAYVYVAQDTQTGAEYALKRLIGADKEACSNIIREINVLKQVSGHQGIISYVAASFIDRTQTKGQAEYLLLTELCKGAYRMQFNYPASTDTIPTICHLIAGGTLMDCVNDPIDPATVLKIAYQMTRAIAHMHSQSPPITHRDIKIENFLIDTVNHSIKLCDFGSATTEIFRPDISWNAQQRNMLEENLANVTTPMYRAPEQLDIWSNYVIGPKVDVWALGCILYCLCHKRHPFEDGAKLRIINANYAPMPGDGKWSCFNDIVRGCFQVDPEKRLDVDGVLERLAAISEAKGWPLRGPLELTGKPIPTGSTEASPSHQVAPPRPAPPRPAPLPQQQQHHPPPPRPADPPVHNYASHDAASASAAVPPMSGGSLFSSIKGGAGSFLKNLKDTSTKVMQTVQQTIARTDLDISYITSRVLVMPCPSEGLEATYRTNNIDDVRVFFESRHQMAKISVYNLGPRATARLPPPVRTVECSFIYYPVGPKAPHLQGLYAMAEDMYGFLRADPKAIVVVQSADQGKAMAATLISALFLYAGLVREPEDAMQMFAVKRTPPGMRPSDLRYLYYMGDLTRSVPHLPHFKPVTLVSLQIAPVPQMTKARDGCRLYIEIVSNDRVDLTTLQEYERMRLYHVTEGKIALPLNITLCGDITVSVYHARNALKGMGRPQGLKVCQLQLYTGFIPEEETLIHFDKNELDELAGTEQIPGKFHLSLSIFVGDTERLPAKSPPWVTGQKAVDRSAQVLFDSTLEYEENLDNFVTKPSTKSTRQERPQRPVAPPPRPETPPPPMKRYEEVDTQQSAEPEPAPFVDNLLNLNGASSIPKLSEIKLQQPAAQQSFDLLGSFDSSSVSEPMPSSFSGPVPDLLGGAGGSSGATSKLDILDDLFSNSSASKGAAFDIGAPLRPNASQAAGSAATAKVQEQPQQAQPRKPSDPFSTLGNVASDWFGLNKGNGATAPPNLSGSPTTSQQQQPTPPMTSPKFPSTPVNQRTPNEAQKPDYSRLNFGVGGAANNATSGKPATATSGDIFGDILGSQGYSFASRPSNSNRSINAMRKEEMVKEMDPEKIKIMEWVRIKEERIMVRKGG